MLRKCLRLLKPSDAPENLCGSWQGLAPGPRGWLSQPWGGNWPALARAPAPRSTPLPDLEFFGQSLEGFLADQLAGQPRLEGHLDQALLWGQQPGRGDGELALPPFLRPMDPPKAPGIPRSHSHPPPLPWVLGVARPFQGGLPDHCADVGLQCTVTRSPHHEAPGEGDLHVQPLRLG